MQENIVFFRKNKELKIGIIITTVILLYILFHVYTFLTKVELPLYEVQPGSIYTVSMADGIILRDEILVTTDIAGYINYYFSEGSRISKNSTVYSIDSNRNMYDLLAGNSSEIKLTGHDLQSLKALLQKNLTNVTADRLAEAKEVIMTGYQRMMDETLMEQLTEIVTQTGITSNFHVVPSVGSGIISYLYDEYTDFSTDDITPSCFTKEYEAYSLYSLELIPAGYPVYKIISGDTWKIVASLSESLYGELLGKTSATIYIDNQTKVTAPLECFRRGDNYYAEISLDKYLSNYASKRFVSVKFELEEVEGLKIPETAVTQKDYYRIPENYVVQGGNSDAKGILVEEFNTETGTAQYTFKEISIFYSENGFVYVDSNDFTKETYIYDSKESNRIMLYTFLTKLEGVYNINKGYAVFKRIERLKTENGYLIIKKGTVSGLSAYDHIALDASAAVEGAVIY